MESNMQRFLILFLILPFFCFSLQACHHKEHQFQAVNVNNPLINEKQGFLFLTSNKLKPGVVTLPSGLQYFIIRRGIGNYPSLKDSVTIYYQGQYIGGKIFDNQHYQKEPINIPILATILGWQQALQLMQPGAIWILYIPPHLAYGDKGLSNIIGPRQTVIYTIHLMAIGKENIKRPK
jgi:FKBP-type peptidyl-prolyl cis-trans isomerase FklB